MEIKEKICIFEDEKINIKTTINILILIMIISGFFGFIYEILFYRIDLGYFVNRGSTYGPWIPIYAFGGLFIVLISYRFRTKPLMVFAINCIITGVLEFFTGYILYKIWNIRLWDYNIEIWNFGNIGGYICLRSIMFFGLSSLFLIYFILPKVKQLSNAISEKKLTIISYCLGIIFIIDIVTHFIITTIY